MQNSYYLPKKFGFDFAVKFWTDCFDNLRLIFFAQFYRYFRQIALPDLPFFVSELLPLFVTYTALFAVFKI